MSWELEAGDQEEERRMLGEPGPAKPVGGNFLGQKEEAVIFVMATKLC